MGGTLRGAGRVGLVLALATAAAALSVTPAEFCDTLVGGACTVAASKVLNCSDGGGAPDAPLSLCNVTLPGALTVNAGVNVTCVDPTACYLLLSVAGGVELGAGSSLVASTVDVAAAGDVVLTAGATLSASGLGPLTGPGAPPVVGNGGSYGGSGGQVPCSSPALAWCQRAGLAAAAAAIAPHGLGVPVTACCEGGSPFLSSNATLGRYSLPPDAGDWAAGAGAGSGSIPRQQALPPSPLPPGGAAVNTTGRGGGRIRVTATGTVTLDGVIAADGGPAGSSSGAVAGGGDPVVGGGSGGTVVITAATLTSTTSIGVGASYARVRANGGAAYANNSASPALPVAGGGGGGRVYITLSGAYELPAGVTTAYGGALPSLLGDSAAACVSGAAGTVWISQQLAGGLRGADTSSSRANVAAAGTTTTTYNQLIVFNTAAAATALAVTPLSVTVGNGAGNGTAVTSTGGGGSDDAPVDSLVVGGVSAVAADALVLRTSLSVEAVAHAALAHWRHRAAAATGPVAHRAATLVAALQLWQSLRALPLPVRARQLRALRRLAAAPASAASAHAATSETAVAATLASGDAPFAGLSMSSGGRMYALTEQGLAASGGVAASLAARLRAGSDLAGCAAAPPPHRGALALPVRGLGASRIPPRAPTAPFNITIVAGEVVLVGSRITAGDGALLVTAGNITVDDQAGIAFESLVSLAATDSLYVDTDIRIVTSTLAHTGGGDSDGGGASSAGWAPGAVQTTPELALRGGADVTVDVNGVLRVPMVTLHCDGNVTVGGRIEARLPAHVLAEVCAQPVVGRERCTDVGWPAGDPAPPLSNYTLVGFAGGLLTVQPQGSAFTSAGLLCGGGVLLQASVSASKLGCMSMDAGSGGAGPSPGLPGASAGGGGGHGGAGGNSSDGGAGGAAFDSDSRPAYFGSAGGSALGAGSGGSGGGYLHVDAMVFVQVEAAAALSADGETPSAEGGGGAGGAIYLRTSALSGSGTITAVGGSGHSGGGGGGGGIVALVRRVGDGSDGSSGSDGETPPTLRLWAAATNSRRLRQLRAGRGGGGVGLLGSIADDFTGVILTHGGDAGGSGARGGGNGTLVTPPCPAGYGGQPRCDPCGVGFWRNGTTGASPFCAVCANKPARGVYTNPTAPTAACDYACPAGYLYPACITPLEALVAAFGGPEGFATAFLGLLVALTLVLLALCRTRSLRRQALRKSAGVLVAKRGGTLAAVTRAARAAAAAVTCGLVRPPLDGDTDDGAGGDGRSGGAVKGAGAGLLMGSSLGRGGGAFRSGGMSGGGGGGSSGNDSGVHAVIALLRNIEDRGRSSGGSGSGAASPSYRSPALSPALRPSAPGGAGSGAAVGGAFSLEMTPGGSLDGRSSFGSRSRASYASGGAGGGGGTSAFPSVSVPSLLPPASTVGVAGLAHLARSVRYQLALLQSRVKGGSQPQAPARPPAVPSDRRSVDFLVAHAGLHDEGDLRRHACRLYLSGSNEWGSPWALPLSPPPAATAAAGAGGEPSLQHQQHGANSAPAPSLSLVRRREYARLAADLNAGLAWPGWGWEAWTHLALTLAAPPAAHYFLQWRRRARVGLLMHALLGGGSAGYDWLRSPRAAALQDSVRLTVSHDLTTAAVDLLSPTPAAGGSPSKGAGGGVPRPLGASGALGASLTSSTALAVGAPRLPLALLLAGDGSLSCPLVLDANDMLVRAVPSCKGLTRFIDAEWLEFVCELNARTRVIAAGAEAQTAGPALAFLAAVNGDADLLGGLHVALVRFWPAVVQATGRRRGGGSGRRGRSSSGRRRHRTKSGGAGGGSSPGRRSQRVSSSPDDLAGGASSAIIRDALSARPTSPSRSSSGGLGTQHTGRSPAMSNATASTGSTPLPEHVVLGPVGLTRSLSGGSGGRSASPAGGGGGSGPGSPLRGSPHRPGSALHGADDGSGSGTEAAGGGATTDGETDNDSSSVSSNSSTCSQTQTSGNATDATSSHTDHDDHDRHDGNGAVASRGVAASAAAAFRRSRGPSLGGSLLPIATSRRSFAAPSGDMASPAAAATPLDDAERLWSAPGLDGFAGSDDEDGGGDEDEEEEDEDEDDYFDDGAVGGPGGASGGGFGGWIAAPAVGGAGGRIRWRWATPLSSSAAAAGSLGADAVSTRDSRLGLLITLREELLGAAAAAGSHARAQLAQHGRTPSDERAGGGASPHRSGGDASRGSSSTAHKTRSPSKPGRPHSSSSSLSGMRAYGGGNGSGSGDVFQFGIGDGGVAAVSGASATPAAAAYDGGRRSGGGGSSMRGGGGRPPSGSIRDAAVGGIGGSGGASVGTARKQPSLREIGFGITPSDQGPMVVTDAVGGGGSGSGLHLHHHGSCGGHALAWLWGLVPSPLRRLVTGSVSAARGVLFGFPEHGVGALPTIGGGADAVGRRLDMRSGMPLPGLPLEGVPPPYSIVAGEASLTASGADGAAAGFPAFLRGGQVSPGRESSRFGFGGLAGSSDGSAAGYDSPFSRAMRVQQVAPPWGSPKAAGFLDEDGGGGGAGFGSAGGNWLTANAVAELTLAAESPFMRRVLRSAQAQYARQQLAALYGGGAGGLVRVGPSATAPAPAGALWRAGISVATLCVGGGSGGAHAAAASVRYHTAGAVTTASAGGGGGGGFALSDGGDDGGLIPHVVGGGAHTVPPTAVATGGGAGGVLSGVSAACARLAFLAHRLTARRTLPPLAMRAPRMAVAAGVLHAALLLLDLGLTMVVLLPELTCVEPLAEAGGAAADSSANVAVRNAAAAAAGGGSCNYAPLVAFLLLPPAAFVAPSLVGLAALALQSAKGLTLYAGYNAASMGSALVATALSWWFAPVLGSSMVALPVALLALKLAAAQLVPRQLAVIEADRPVRGWRGLYEVRAGPAERSRAAGSGGAGGGGMGGGGGGGLY
jgi:hypothetical protein